MSICKIDYNEGFFLDDDALLYDNAAWNAIFGDLIPVLQDEGTCATFETKDDIVQFISMFKMAGVSGAGNDVEWRIWQTALRQAAGILRRPVSPEAYHGFARLRLPDPIMNAGMYQLGEVDATDFRLFVFCGMKSRDGCDLGWSPARVAEWMMEKADGGMPPDAGMEKYSRKTSLLRKLNWLATGVLSILLCTGLSVEAGEAVKSDRDAVRPSISVGFTPGDAEQLVLDVIRGAKKELRMAAYKLSSPRIVKALSEAIGRGVDTRVVLDGKGETKTFLEANVPFRRSVKYSIMHHKFIVADGSVLQTGSFNYTVNAANTHAENVIVMQDQIAAESYIKEWNRLWEESQ